MVDLSQKAKQAGYTTCWRVVPANPKSIPSPSLALSLPTSTSTSATNRKIGRCFQSARPPAAHPVLLPSVPPSLPPSTSMINCRSMHFKNVNLSYMPRSIRLCPKRNQNGRQTDPKSRRTDPKPRNGMEWKICVRKCFRRAAEIKLKMYNR